MRVAHECKCGNLVAQLSRQAVLAHCSDGNRFHCGDLLPALVRRLTNRAKSALAEYVSKCVAADASPLRRWRRAHCNTTAGAGHASSSSSSSARPTRRL